MISSFCFLLHDIGVKVQTLSTASVIFSFLIYFIILLFKVVIFLLFLFYTVNFLLIFLMLLNKSLFDFHSFVCFQV